MIEDIRKVKMIERFLREGRWYVRIEPSYLGKTTMPQAVYVWLCGNPAFIDIPKGYLVHHLDMDELNDDISNLVIMQKHHHVAYHWKQKNILPSVKMRSNFRVRMNGREEFYPIHEPRIYEYKKGRFCLRFQERIQGKIQRVQIGSWENRVLSTREMAEEIKRKIWNRGHGGGTAGYEDMATIQPLIDNVLLPLKTVN